MISERLTQLRRDVTMVVSSLLGNPPPPLVRRGARHVRPAVVAAAKALGRPLRIDAIERETDDMVSLVLACPTGAPIELSAGQFFTLVVPVDGVLHRRAYSASSLPGDLGGRVRVTVKRVEGGIVSRRLTSDLTKVGEVLTVLGPSGSFVPRRAEGPRTVGLVAGGSGITPMMAIAKFLLTSEPDTRVRLLFGNRRRSDIPFLAELEGLAATGRFSVRHVLAEADESGEHGVGMLTGDVLSRELPAFVGDGLESVFVCGPEGMMDAARSSLLAAGVVEASIFEERFASPKSNLRARAPAGPVEVTVQKGTSRKRVLQTVDQTLLEAGLAAGLDMPFSCAMGGCGACKVRVLSGETTRDGSALTPAERDAGYVLACVDRGLGPCAVELP